jgi:hypothetical protein
MKDFGERVSLLCKFTSTVKRTFIGGTHENST